MAGRRYRERSPPPRATVSAEVLRRSTAEERIASNQREIQALLLDNQRLAATHVALKQELSVAPVRDVYERSVKMKAEVRSLDALGPDLAQVKADVQKKVHVSNLEQSQVMEKEMISLAQEIEKLPAELANAEKRAIAAAAAANPYLGYASGYANPSTTYDSNSYTDSYAMHQVQGSVAFVQSAPHSSYDIQQNHFQQ